VSIIEANRRFPSSRPRRMRRDEFSRRLMRETRLTTDDLIYPLFIVEGSEPASAYRLYARHRAPEYR
jgi:porphobilinogen synthase